MMLNRIATRTVFAASILCGAWGTPWAQSPNGQGSPPYGARTQEAMPSPTEEAVPSPSAVQTSVLLITSVEVIRSTRPTPLDMIRVRGLTATTGWSEPSLKPLTQGVPPDGILDMLFVADAPPTNSTPMGFSPIAIIFPLLPGQPYHGVRVRGAFNAITVDAIPGYGASDIKFEDCAHCIGKIFVPSGGALPSDKAEADVVRQEALPPSLRIVKPTDGIHSTENDPNRLTIVIGEGGRIVDIGWD